MRQQNFIVCELKFTNVSAFDVESIVVVNAVFRLSISPDFVHVLKPPSSGTSRGKVSLG